MLYVVVAEICESALARTVTYSAIQEAFRSALRPGWGQWVGPGPRVVRGRFDGCNAATATKAAWLLDLPFDEAGRIEAQRDMQPRLLAALAALMGAPPPTHPSWWTVLMPALGAAEYAWLTVSRSPGNWDVAFVPYAPAMSGDRSWWESGQAALTRTRDTADFGPKENILGPDNLLPTQVTLLDRGLQTQTQVIGNVTKIIVAVSVLLAIVYFGPALARWLAASRGPAFPPPRQPPRQLPPGARR